MTITAYPSDKNYTLGRGRLFFSRFTPAQIAAGIAVDTQPEGELYFGNTPALTATSATEKLDHFDSDEGVKVKDDSVQLSFDRTGTFSCDNISKENLALLFLSAAGAATVSQGSATASVYVTPAVKRGRFYQIGITSGLPMGVRKVSNVVVKSGSPGFATTVAQATNYEIDEELGRIRILPAAPGIPDDTILQITYDLAATTTETIISGSQSIYGSLYFQATNPKGKLRDYLWPYVELAPDGDFALKGDDWQNMNFNFEVLKKGSLEACYITARPT